MAVSSTKRRNPSVSKGQLDPQLTRAEFGRRFLLAFDNPESHAQSHGALDRDEAIFEETRNAARTVIEGVRRLRAGQAANDAALECPRQK